MKLPTEVFCKLSVLRQPGSSWYQEAKLFCRTDKILPGSLWRGKRATFSEIFLQNTSIFARKPGGRKKCQIYPKFSCRTHQVLPKERNNENTCLVCAARWLLLIIYFTFGAVWKILSAWRPLNSILCHRPAGTPYPLEKNSKKVPPVEKNGLNVSPVEKNTSPLKTLSFLSSSVKTVQKVSFPLINITIRV